MTRLKFKLCVLRKLLQGLLSLGLLRTGLKSIVFPSQ